MKNKSLWINIIVLAAIFIPTSIIAACLKYFSSESFWESTTSGLLVTAIQFGLITLLLENFIKKQANKEATYQQIKSLLEDIDFSRNKSNSAASQIIFFAIIKLNAKKISKINLRDCFINKEQKNIGGISLIQSELSKLRMTDCDLPFSKFNFCLGDNALFDLSILYESDFSNATLLNCSFVSCNLLKANFDNASLINANFRDAILKDANFNNAILDGADFTNVSTLLPMQLANCKSAIGIKINATLLSEIHKINPHFTV